MMDFLKNWIFSVCLTLILAVIFSVMTPKGRLGQFYKMIISMFIFVSFLYPVSNNGINDFKIDLPMFNNSYAQQLQDVQKNNVEAVVTEQLKKIGVNANVSSEIKLRNNEIEIESLTVYIPDSDSKSKVSEYLLGELGLVAEVKYIGE